MPASSAQQNQPPGLPPLSSTSQSNDINPALFYPAGTETLTASSSNTPPTSMNASSVSSHRRRYLARSNSPSSAEASLTQSERSRTAQQTRREIAEKVNEDWEFEWEPSTRTDSDNLANDSRTSQILAAESNPTDGVPNLPYRLRSFSSNSNSSSSSRSQSPTASFSHPEKESSYKFETPDSVLPVISSRRLRNHHKKRRLLEEQMTWNAGLSHWAARRDAWSGGRVERHQKPPPQQYPSHSLSRDECPTSFTSAHEELSQSTTTEVVPVHAPLLPQSHPIRAAITPAAYPQIYSKVVLRSLAPNIPINLADMTGALVAGWKADGDWPPKGTGEREVAIARRKGGGKGGGGDGNRGEAGAEAEGRGGRRSSVKGKMKKVLALRLGSSGGSGTIGGEGE
ncbi:MAG: hypothetical protein M1837_005876 [Sclerophora amabilis]|nr:MAG: hypothetical protein M1837_005876 [Sclerophora amabilis]